MGIPGLDRSPYSAKPSQLPSEAKDEFSDIPKLTPSGVPAPIQQDVSQPTQESAQPVQDEFSDIPTNQQEFVREPSDTFGIHFPGIKKTKIGEDFKYEIETSKDKKGNTKYRELNPSETKFVKSLEEAKIYGKAPPVDPYSIASAVGAVGGGALATGMGLSMIPAATAVAGASASGLYAVDMLKTLGLIKDDKVRNTITDYLANFTLQLGSELGLGAASKGLEKIALNNAEMGSVYRTGEKSAQQGMPTEQMASEKGIPLTPAQALKDTPSGPRVLQNEKELAGIDPEAFRAFQLRQNEAVSKNIKQLVPEIDKTFNPKDAFEYVQKVLNRGSAYLRDKVSQGLRKQLFYPDSVLEAADSILKKHLGDVRGLINQTTGEINLNALREYASANSSDQKGLQSFLSEYQRLRNLTKEAKAQGFGSRVNSESTPIFDKNFESVFSGVPEEQLAFDVNARPSMEGKITATQDTRLNTSTGEFKPGNQEQFSRSIVQSGLRGSEVKVPQALKFIPQGSAGAERYGITYEQVASMVDRMQNLADFASKDRPQWKKAMGELAYSARVFEGDVVREGLEREAQLLRSQGKDSEATAKEALVSRVKAFNELYYKNIDQVKAMQNFVGQNETPVAQWAISESHKDPERFKNMFKLLHPDEQKSLSATILNELHNANIETDITGTSITGISASQMKAKFDSMEESVKKQIFKEDLPKIKTIMSLAEGIEKNSINVTPSNIEKQMGLPLKELGKLRYTPLWKIGSWISGLFANIPDAKEYLAGRLPKLIEDQRLKAEIAEKTSQKYLKAAAATSALRGVTRTAIEKNRPLKENLPKQNPFVR